MAYNYDDQARAILYENRLEHYGILGQRWGQRRYQNLDGSLTQLGRRHYGVGERIHPVARTIIKRSHLSKLRDEEAALKNRSRIMYKQANLNSDLADKLRAKRQVQTKKVEAIRRSTLEKTRLIEENDSLTKEEKAERIAALNDSVRPDFDKAMSKHIKTTNKLDRANERMQNSIDEYRRVMAELAKYPEKMSSVKTGELGYDYYMKRKVGKYISKTGTARYGIYKTVVTKAG